MKKQIRKKINSAEDVELMIDPDEYAAKKPVVAQKPVPQPVPLYCIERPGIFTQNNGQQILVMPMTAQAIPTPAPQAAPVVAPAQTKAK